MSTADGRLWMAYNGEVYNYLELRQELEGFGHRFRSHTDSEVILYAYRQWGLDAFPRLNGMWALAIWDRDTNQLLLSRDRVGVKPMVFHQDGRRVLFASEVKGLLAAEPQLARLDEQAVASFLQTTAFAIGHKSFFEKIEVVPPATTLLFDIRGTVVRRRYWTFRPPVEPRRIEVERAAEELRELLTDSVRLRFRSDVPVGTCLSGGLDSSSIVAIAAKRLGKAPATFSALYDAPGYSETVHVRTMANELGLTAHDVSPTGEDLMSVLEAATYFQESPTGGPGVYSQWHVMKLAAGHVKVLLDGQGSDELFAGYFPYFSPYFRGLVARISPWELRSVPRAVRARNEIFELTGTDPARELLRPAKAKLRRRLRAALGSVLGPAWKNPVRGPRGPNLVSERMAAIKDLGPESGAPYAGSDRLTSQLWDALTRTSIPGLLHYEDRNSMAHSIEARVPFLDYRIIELAFSLPTECKIEGAWTKLVLREAMKGLLPESVRQRRDKLGYPTPMELWLRTSGSDWLSDLLLSDRAISRDFVTRAGVLQLVSTHMAGQADHSWRLFQLATLEMFCRRFVDQPFQAAPPPPNAVLSGP